jgi:hypothetical protein
VESRPGLRRDHRGAAADRLGEVGLRSLVIPWMS